MKLKKEVAKEYIDTPYNLFTNTATKNYTDYTLLLAQCRNRSAQVGIYQIPSHCAIAHNFSLHIPIAIGSL